MDTNTHTFAIYDAAAPLHIGVATFFAITDPEIIHRIRTVLRLQKDDRCIIFNNQYHYTGHIGRIEKKEVHFVIEQRLVNQLYQPSITAYLPLLKKNNLEEAIYNATEIGIQHIQLYTSQKCYASSWSTHTQERLHKQMIAAAEISKNYYGTRIHAPIPISLIASQASNTLNIVFETDGQSIATFLVAQAPTNNQNIACLIGPESGLTNIERGLLQEQAWHTVCLTPTVIRACQAVTLAGGLLRSWYTNT